METDTDSLYIALSKETLVDCVSKSKLDSFLHEIRNWMPIYACHEHFDDYCNAVKSKKEWKPRPCCCKSVEHLEVRGEWQ